MLKKQAKILTTKQIKLVLKYLDGTKRNRERNKVIFLLSVMAGLRAKGIADLEMGMVLNAEGELAQAISLHDRASKGNSGRVIPINKVLRSALEEYLLVRKHQNSKYVITSERSEKFSANAIAVFFKRLYDDLGFVGCSSHSGRRGFITNCARKVFEAGGSMKDVMQLSGHSQMASVQRYIETDPKAQKKLIELLYSL